MQNIFFSMVLVWIWWFAFFPRSMGKNLRVICDKFMSGWNDPPREDAGA